MSRQWHTPKVVVKMKSNSLPGFNSPSASTEAPLEMLSACHGRVESQCQTLQRLVAHLGTNGCDHPAHEAATAVMRYFDTAAKHHHEDEEQDLFPALLESMAGSDAVCLKDLIEQLKRDHRTLEDHWRQLRQALLGVLSGDASQLTADSVNGFVRAYEAHIAQEENHLLPMAHRLLSEAALQQVGRAMRERRGIAPR